MRAFLASHWVALWVIAGGVFALSFCNAIARCGRPPFRRDEIDQAMLDRSIRQYRHSRRA